MKNQRISRRNFLSQSASTAVVAAAALAGVPRSLLAAEDYGGKKIPIGLQLYTVGRSIQGDVAGTLAQLAKVGYQGVEFAGYFNLDAKALRKVLDDNGLKCCGSHVQLGMIQGDKLEKTIEFNQTIGNTRLIVPSLGGNYTSSKKSLEDVAEAFNEIADKLKPAGMRTGSAINVIVDVNGCGIS